MKNGKMKFEFLQKYDIVTPDIDSVREYICGHFDILIILDKVSEKIRNVFQSLQYQVSLEVFYDSKSEIEYLIFYIRHENYPDNIMDLINSVYEEEVIHFLTKRKFCFLITTDFEKPI